MARKNKNEEVSIIETKLDSDTVTDLEVLIGDKKVGSIHQGEEDRQIEVTFNNGQKTRAISIEDAVQAILADFNLHN